MKRISIYGIWSVAMSLCPVSCGEGTFLDPLDHLPSFEVGRTLSFAGRYRFEFGKNGEGALFDGDLPYLYLADHSFHEEKMHEVKPGDSLLQVCSKVGFPRFLSNEANQALDFGRTDIGAYYRLRFDVRGKLATAPIRFEADDLRVYSDPYRLQLPSREDFGFLKAGKTSVLYMVSRIGKPRFSPYKYREFYYFHYDLLGDRYFSGTFLFDGTSLLLKKGEIYHHDYGVRADRPNDSWIITEELFL